MHTWQQGGSAHGGCVCSGKVSGQWGGLPREPVGGLSMGEGRLPRGMSAPVHAGITPPPVNRITDTCKNITLPQLRCKR